MIRNTGTIIAFCVAAGVCLPSMSEARQSTSAQTQSYATVSYAHWKAWTPSQRRLVVLASISALSTGWTFGSERAYVVYDKILADEYQSGGVSAYTMNELLRTGRQTGPPLFSKPVAAYVALVDRELKTQAKRGQQPDIGTVLLCVSDRPPEDCTPARRPSQRKK
jgi:hypothetical protein